MSPRILVVCSGNVCRSPMAEGYLRHRFGQMDQGVVVESAGTIGLDGHPASEEAVQVARENGFSIDAHRGRRIEAGMVRDADVVLVMEKRHARQLTRDVPDAASRVRLLSEYGSAMDRGQDVPDPVSEPVQTYRAVFIMMKGCLDGFIDWWNMQEH